MTVKCNRHKETNYELMELYGETVEQHNAGWAVESKTASEHINN